MLVGAFIGWQLAGSLAGGAGKFQDYARRLGVLKKPVAQVVTPEEAEAARAKAVGLHNRLIQGLKA